MGKTWKTTVPIRAKRLELKAQAQVPTSIEETVTPHPLAKRPVVSGIDQRLERHTNVLVAQPSSTVSSIPESYPIIVNNNHGRRGDSKIPYKLGLKAPVEPTDFFVSSCSTSNPKFLKTLPPKEGSQRKVRGLDYSDESDVEDVNGQRQQDKDLVSQSEHDMEEEESWAVKVSFKSLRRKIRHHDFEMVPRVADVKSLGSASEIWSEADWDVVDDEHLVASICH